MWWHQDIYGRDVLLSIGAAFIANVHTPEVLVHCYAFHRIELTRDVLSNYLGIPNVDK